MDLPADLADAVRAMVAQAIAAERQRTAALLLELAEQRRLACGGPDQIVVALAMLGNEITDPDR